MSSGHFGGTPFESNTKLCTKKIFKLRKRWIPLRKDIIKNSMCATKIQQKLMKEV